ncbi:MAG: tRNA preQ1(34) S-adenosylmethionine ribosyltransferase-isomerase QueA [Chthonomonas sp.]|nr:tRNA preQ1(34) S-adenosylmethionine ribosyltransferase-isomerase QueA [Chthonomonas sp.]
MLTLSDFDFELPEDRIAQVPLEQRDASKLLCVDVPTAAISDRVFRDLPNLLEPGDLLVFNDTRVTAKRLIGRKPTGGVVEALLLGRLAQANTYVALMRPGKRLREGSEVLFEDVLPCLVESDLGDGRKRIRFLVSDSEEHIERVGAVPLPPYIHERLENSERYQTVYSHTPGSSAAPTAGLHFTQELIATLESKGIQTARVTLDVGIDTFRPVQAERISDHKMHGERCAISTEAQATINGCKGRIIAVGTTACRTLESFATGRRKVDQGERVTEIFITPGYPFQVVECLLTNFHMPRTSMLFMVSALTGVELWRSSYEHALQHNYRFLSFGDSMLIRT